MLLKCPECELQVSDKALTCPHCGYPLKQTSKPRKPRKKNNKRRRLPNGFGQITEIKNRNLRNPFRAMITVGKYPNGKPICKLLKPEAYFPTYNDAYAALVEYNKNPYDLDNDITVKELYDIWFVKYCDEVKECTSNAMKRAWRYCSAVYNMRAKDLRARHIKGCMEEGRAIIKGKERTPSALTKNHIKTLFNKMMDYAVEYELINKNYSRDFKLSKDTIQEIQSVKKEHIPFEPHEMELLWNNIYNNEVIDMILIQCYSGWRPRELLSIKLDCVDLKEGFIIEGVKTESGFSRIVPIHSRIKDLIINRYYHAKEINSDFLFNTIKNKKFSYNYYKENFDIVCSSLELNPDHRPHDGRKHFVTMAKEYEMDEYAIKYIVGHKISDITEKIYTERKREWLKDEIEKIK